MRIEIVIDAPKGWKRRVLMFVATPLGLLGLAVGVALATVPNSFSNGQTLDATQLNQNFSSLDTRISALEAFKTQATADGGYSLGGKYCGATAPTQGSVPGGYSGAKTLCAAASGCGAGAHMCTVDEMVRSASLGLGGPGVGGWIASGNSIAGEYDNGTSYAEVPNVDCELWSTSSTTYYGTNWSLNPSNNSFNSIECSNTIPILCCN